MKKFVTLTLATLMVAGMFAFTGCRATHRRTTWFSGDKNVTVVRHKRRKAYKPRTKAVTSRHHNRAAGK